MFSDPVDPTADEVVRHLLSQAPGIGIVLFDRELRVRLAEGAALTAVGVVTERVRGRYVQELSAPDVAELYMSHYRAALSGEEGRIEIPSPAGNTYGIFAGPIRDEAGEIIGGIGVLQDVTERVRNQRAVFEAEALYRLLAETSTDIVSLHDTEGTYLWISPSVTPQFGYREDQVLGKTAFDFVHPDDAATAAECIATLTRGEESTQTITMRMLHGDGEYKWIESVVSTITDLDGAPQLRVASRDITDRKGHERELEATSAELGRRLAETRALARIGECALEEPDPTRVMDIAVEATADVLGVPLAAIVELHSPTTLLVRSGVGWKPGLIGSVIPATLRGGDEVLDKLREGLIAREVDAGRDFDISILRDHGATSGAQVLIGEARAPFGALGLWSREGREFDDHDRDFLRAVATIVGDAVLRRRAEDAALHEAMHDRVTGLPNRALLLDRLTRALDRRREGGRVGVFLVDLDAFQVVNDSISHAAGDEVLAQVGPRLRGVLRPSDTIARFGGDSFAVICEDLHDDAHAQRLAERVTSAFARPFTAADESFFISASIGVVVAMGGDSPHDVLRDADAAVHRAKEAGRNRYELFDPRMRERILERLRTEGDLRRALASEELRVHFQPICALPERKLVAAEALVRWQHPERGLVAPGEFIPIAEDTGLIIPLGTWVLRTACRQVAKWTDLDVTVNMSARQLAQPEIVQIVRRALTDSGLPGERLGLEITEGLLMQDSEPVAQSLAGLKALGVKLILDDFGTGYSSLSYLKRFPLDRLKIDRSFVAGLLDHEGDAALVEAIVAMAHALQLGVIPEGVETEEQLALLERVGCRHAQGFLLGMPQSAADLEGAFPALRGGVSPTP